MGSLYRKYRPRSLDDVVGQKNVVDLLKSSLAAGSTAHAYLLSGPHGVGKTSIARILAHDINKLAYSDDATELDIIEIDAASNNGVDDIRELRERVNIAPANSAKKIYIIDEVHMLSKSAFNALLKTLEEPPEHVVFILATTEPDKLPDTIISRVQRYNFKAIGLDDIVSHLRTIADKESITIDDAALVRIAEYGRGSFRDSIGVLDQLRTLSGDSHEITSSDVETTLGIAPHEKIESLLAAHRSNDLPAIARHISELESDTVKAGSVADALIRKVQSSIATHPQELPLLDSLLDVSDSRYPYMKLLTALCSHISSQTTPVVAPSKPQSSTKQTQVAKPSEKSVPLVATPQKREPTIEAAPAKKPVTPSVTHPFSWQDFLADINKGSAAAHSLLAKSGYDYTDGTLTIYAGSTFAAKKLDTAKYRSLLSEVVVRYGIDAEAVSIVPTKKPPSDATSASIAAIMGGGEEVNI